MTTTTMAVALGLSAPTVAIKDDPAARQFGAAKLEARVTNTGGINDQFNLDILDLPPGWFTRSKPSSRLFPGDNDLFSIEFHPPRTPESTAGPHPFKVRATPQEQPDKLVEYSVTLIIPPFADTTMEVAPQSQETIGDAVYRLRLRNGGNIPLTYTLAPVQPEEPDRALAVAFLTGGVAGEAVARVTIEPGQEATPEFRVSAPPLGGVARSPGAFPFTIQATPVPDGGVWPTPPPAPLTASGAFILRPPAPIEVTVAPAPIELIDTLLTSVDATITIRNPNRCHVGLRLEARPPGGDYEIKLESGRDRLTLDPDSTTELTLTVARNPLAPPATAPTRQPFQLTARQIELPFEPTVDPDAPPIARAAPGTVTLTVSPQPVEVVIQPLPVAVELTPPRARGGTGKFKVVVTNKADRRVPVTLRGEDAERQVECYFGPQPSGWKRIFRRAKRHAAWEAQSALNRRMGARLSQAATVLDVPNAEDVVDRGGGGGEEENLARWGAYDLVLSPGDRVEVPLEVRPSRARLVGQSRFFPFMVGTAVAGQEAPALTRPGEFEHRPLPWLLILLIGLLLLSPLLIIIPLKLGCDRGSLEFGPFCVPGAPPAVAPAALRQEGGPEGRTKVFLRDGTTLRQVGEEPAKELPGQFAKLVVPSPDKERVLYATAKDEMLTGAVLKIATASTPPQALPPIEKARLWPAKPVWCQAKPGDQGRIAYVAAVAPASNRSGLELRVLNLADAQVEHKVALQGTTGSGGNGFEPSIFYGRAETPLLWWDNCNAIKYTGANGKRWLVNLSSGSATEIRTFNLPDAPPVSAQGAPTTACESVKPFAQTDPRWAEQVIGGQGGPTIGAAGCALTAAATVFQYYGATSNPNQVLTGCDLTPTTSLNWAEAAQKCAPGKVKNTVWKENPAYADIAAALAGKQPAIVGMAGGPSGSHYVIVAGGSGENGGDYRIVDPWDGTTYKRLGDYLETGTYRLKYLVRYEGDAPVCSAGAGAGAAAIKFSGIADGGTSQQPVRVTFEAPAGASATHTSGASFDKEGFHSIGVALADGTYRTHNFFVDGQPPVTSGEFKQDKDKLSGLLTLSAKDTITPVAVTRYFLDGEPEKEYTGDGENRGNILARGVPMEFKAGGDYSVMVYSIDAAGNKETPRRVTFKVEVKMPTPQLSPQQLNLLRDKVDGVLTLSALDGVGDMSWKAEPDASAKPWLTIDPPQGALKAGAQQKLTVKIERSKIPPGQFTGQVIVTSKAGATEFSATAEVVGEVLAPPTPTPIPPASATATAAREVVATHEVQGPASPGTGACSDDQQPVVEPNQLTISHVGQIGKLAIRDRNNACIMWYAAEYPTALRDWLILTAEDINPITGSTVVKDLVQYRNGTMPDHRITTPDDRWSTITIRPTWVKDEIAGGSKIAGTMTEGRVVLRDDDKQRAVVLTFQIALDRKSITVEVRHDYPEANQ